VTLLIGGAKYPKPIRTGPVAAHPAVAIVTAPGLFPLPDPLATNAGRLEIV
jgi:hypothetical protein